MVNFATCKPMGENGKPMGGKMILLPPTAAERRPLAAGRPHRLAKCELNGPNPINSIFCVTIWCMGFKAEMTKPSGSGIRIDMKNL